MNTFTKLLRVLVGALFVGHGTQKLFGWFGGHGLDGTSQFFDSLGLKPGRRNATAAGITEAGGGALLAAGVATPLAATALSATMISAVSHVHWKNGIWSTDGGFEYNLVLLGAIAAATAEDSGPAWAVAQLAAGAAGSIAMSELAKREASEPEEPAEPEPREQETSWTPDQIAVQTPA